ncbi:hypothetical protein WBU96_28565 [Bacillus albus]|uniref:hypothetical protein n=1 Tax=Bacillus albus TaxID=2026189 RepID=UPI0030152650
MTNTFTIGQKVTGAAAMQAMETHKVKNTDHNGFVFWFEEGKLMGYANDVKTDERNRSITYFQRNTFEVIGLITPPYEKGDLVKITSEKAADGLAEGAIVEVVSYDPTKVFALTIKKENGNDAIIVEEYAQKLTEGEVKQHEEAKHFEAVNKLEKGAFVRIANGNRFGSNFETGDIAVVMFQEHGLSGVPIRVAPLHTPTNGASEWARCNEVEIVTEEEAIKAKLELVEVGAHVKIVGDKYTKPRYASHGLKNDRVIIVTSKHRDGFGIAGKADGKGFTLSIHALDFEIMTPKEVKAYKDSQVNTEKGAYLIVTGQGTKKYDIGEVVVAVGRKSNDGLYITKLDGSVEGFKYYENLRNATPAEVEEAKRKQEEREIEKVFTDLGREVGEFKTGDIVKVLDNRCGDHVAGDIGEVMGNHCNAHDAEVRVYGRSTSARWAKVQLLVAVENRLDQQK